MVIAAGMNFVFAGYQMLLVPGSTQPKGPRGMQGQARRGPCQWDEQWAGGDFVDGGWIR